MSLAPGGAATDVFPVRSATVVTYVMIEETSLALASSQAALLHGAVSAVLSLISGEASGALGPAPLLQFPISLQF